MSIDSLHSVADVIDLLRSKDLLPELGLTPGHAGTMKTRGRIPPHWHVRVVQTSEKHGLPVTYELLARLAAQSAGAEFAGELGFSS